MAKFIIEVPDEAIAADQFDNWESEEIAKYLGEVLEAAGEAWTSSGDRGHNVLAALKVTPGQDKCEWK